MPLLVCMSLFFTCLILIFLSFFCELLVHVSCGLGLWLLHGLKNRHGVIGWRSQDLWFMSKNRIQRTARPPRDKNWSVCFLLSSALSCFSLHTEFPFLCFLEASLVSHSSLFWIWLAMSLRSALLEHDLSIQVPVTI